MVAYFKSGFLLTNGCHEKKEAPTQRKPDYENIVIAVLIKITNPAQVI